jgi:hypothetical protein
LFYFAVRAERDIEGQLCPTENAVALGLEEEDDLSVNRLEGEPVISEEARLRSMRPDTQRAELLPDGPGGASRQEDIYTINVERARGGRPWEWPGFFAGLLMPRGVYSRRHRFSV